MDSALIIPLINLGWGGILVLLIITGVLVTGREHKKLETDYSASQRALELERQRNADLQIWAMTGARALQAVAKVAEERAQPTPPEGFPLVPGG